MFNSNTQPHFDKRSEKALFLEPQSPQKQLDAVEKAPAWYQQDHQQFTPQHLFPSTYPISQHVSI